MKPENPMEWLPCPRCGLRPLVWEFDNGRFTACGCGTDCYSHWSVRAESIMSVIKRSDNGKSAEVYDIDELKNNWNHWVRTGGGYCLRQGMGNGNMINNLRYGSLFGYNSNDIG